MFKTLNRTFFAFSDTNRFRLILFGSSILMILFRAPALLLYPRLWAEEGTIFYVFARHHTIGEIFTTSHVGYLTFFNSIISLLQAKCFSVEYAPIVSTVAGFLVQLVPVYIITFTSCKFWDNPLKKVLSVFICILTTAPELWLNTTNSHFIFGLITFLLMMVPAQNVSFLFAIFSRILLIIGSLTGPASLFFFPVLYNFI